MNADAILALIVLAAFLIALVVLALVVLAVEWIRDRRARRAMDDLMAADVMAELEAISPDWVEREQERFRREREER